MRVFKRHKINYKQLIYALTSGLVILGMSGSFVSKVLAAGSDEITVTYPYYGFVDFLEKSRIINEIRNPMQMNNVCPLYQGMVTEIIV